MAEKKKKAKVHLLILRLIAGIVFLVFGVLHFIQPENFKNILIATQIPFVQINLFFVPAIEVLVGIFLIIGFLVRLSGVVGAITMLTATWSTQKLMRMDPDHLPGGLTEIPFSPPIFVPILLFLICVYLIFRGKGSLCCDKSSKK